MLEPFPFVWHQVDVSHHVCPLLEEGTYMT